MLKSILIARSLCLLLATSVAESERLVRLGAIDVSADGKKLVFSGHSDDGGTLFVSNRDGSQAKAILRAKSIALPEEGTGYFPKFNRKGNSILFLRKSREKLELCKIRPSGGEVQIIATPKTGSTISYAVYDKNDVIYFSEITSQNETVIWRKAPVGLPRLVMLLRGRCSVGIDPDRKKIAWCQNTRSGNTGIFIRKFGTKQNRLVSKASSEFKSGPLFSQDGKGLLYVKGDRSGQLHLLSLANLKDLVVTPTKWGVAVRNPCLTKDGNVLFLDWGRGYREVDLSRSSLSEPLDLWLGK